METFIKDIYNSGENFIITSVYKQFVDVDNASRHTSFISELKKNRIPFREVDVGYLYHKKNRRYIKAEKLVCITHRDKNFIRELISSYGVRSFVERENGTVRLYSLRNNQIKGVQNIRESLSAQPSFNLKMLIKVFIESNQKYPIDINYVVEKSNTKWVFLSEGTSTRFKTILYGKDWLVQSFGIITPENPSGKEADPHYNASVREEFENFLKKMKYKFFRVKGKYGSEEKSYMVLNINLADLKFIANEYRQKAFIYAKQFVDSKGEPSMNYYYYEVDKKNRKWKKDYQYEYRVLSSTPHVKDARGLKNFYTSLKSFKFNIPFPIFESNFRTIYVNLWESFDGYNFDILKESIHFSINQSNKYTVKHRWVSRCLLFESPRARKERVKDLLKIAETKRDKRWARSQLAENFFLKREKLWD